MLFFTFGCVIKIENTGLLYRKELIDIPQHTHAHKGEQVSVVVSWSWLTICGALFSIITAT